MTIKGINKYKYPIIALHFVGLILCAIIAYTQIHLRWQSGYVVFWTTAITGIMFMFLMWKRYWSNAIIKLYGFLWIPFSLIGLFLSVIVWQPVLCETDNFVMRKPGGFMCFETAILYRKYGLRELEIHRYELVFPESITPLDSLGAVVIYGEYSDGEGGCGKGTVIYPMDDYTYYNNIDRVKEYAGQRDIEYMRTYFSNE